MFSLDAYDRKARLQPALWTALSVLVAALLLLPSETMAWRLLLGFLTYAGGATVLVQHVRNRGKSVEPALFDLWDGKPSVAMLRHRDSRLNTAAKLRYHAFLQSRIPGLKFPSQADEQSCPREADETYESAGVWLRAQTRDSSRFPMVFQENVNYGFRRNLWAMRPTALGIDVLTFLLFALYAASVWQGSMHATLARLSPEVIACAALVGGHALVCLFGIRPNAVRVVAEEYARQLLSACDVLALAE